MTHTILAVAVVAGLVAVGVRFAGRGRALPARAALWAGAVYASHLLLDFLTTDSVPPYGARFLWPLSDAYWQAPVALLPEVVIDPSGRSAFFVSLVHLHTVGTWAFEVGLLSLTVVAVHAVRAWQGVPTWRDAPEEP